MSAIVMIDNVAEFVLAGGYAERMLQVESLISDYMDAGNVGMVNSLLAVRQQLIDEENAMIEALAARYGYGGGSDSDRQDGRDCEY